MKILLTNDDGIDAPGFDVLRDIAEQLTDAENIWEAAPLTNQSGVGHCISYVHPLTVNKRSDRAIAVEGYPADCVLAALATLPERPDLILSGVNNGNNSGQNTVYSGTIGAAMEGALQGIPSIALSQYFGPKLGKGTDKYSAARATAPDLIRKLVAHGDWGGGNYMTFYSVNFPPVPAEDVQGIKACKQGFRPVPYFATAADAPNKRSYLHITSGSQQDRAEEGSDVAANLDGFVSVTPMSADLTRHSTIDALAAKLNE